MEEKPADLWKENKSHEPQKAQLKAKQEGNHPFTLEGMQFWDLSSHAHKTKKEERKTQNMISSVRHFYYYIAYGDSVLNLHLFNAFLMIEHIL